jgi:sugar phosphate isomerase/epimerase
MRIGVDGLKIPESAKRGPLLSLDHARELGLAGLFYRTVLQMSPTLDGGALREIREHADELGMYIETGLGKVNPYANPETPELRAVGDGDIVLGFRRMMEACAAIDCRELWTATASYKSAFRGRWAYDRFRTDVTWAEQLEAIQRFLLRLAPIARDLGIHINMETHEEITSFELVRLVEAVGPDVTGIVYDTANLLQRVEHPVWSARRVAPYVRQTHIKDAAIASVDDDCVFQLRPCGTGVVEFAELLPVLAAANPTLNLSIENDESLDDRPRSRELTRIEIHNRDFLAGHPDLTDEELAAYVAMVEDFDRRVEQGEAPSPAQYAAQAFGYAETVTYIQDSAAHLRAICLAQQLPLTDAPLPAAV